MDAAQPGVQYEGDVPTPTPDDDLAFRPWSALHNGMGGISWAGWDRVVAWLGIADEERLINQLMVIKAYKPAQEDDDATTLQET